MFEPKQIDCPLCRGIGTIMDNPPKHVGSRYNVHPCGRCGGTGVYRGCTCHPTQADRDEQEAKILRDFPDAKIDKAQYARVLVMLLVMFCALRAGQAHAATYTWNGSSGNMSLAASWNPTSGPPGSGDTILISATNGTSPSSGSVTCLTGTVGAGGAGGVPTGGTLTFSSTCYTANAATLSAGPTYSGTGPVYIGTTSGSIGGGLYNLPVYFGPLASGSITGGTFNYSTTSNKTISNASAVFNGPTIIGAGTVSAGTFNNTVTINAGTISGGSFGGAVAFNGGTMSGGTYALAVTASSGATFTNTTPVFNGSVIFQNTGGTSTLYSTTSPAVAPASMVWSGTSNLGTTGTLGLPATGYVLQAAPAWGVGGLTTGTLIVTPSAGWVSGGTTFTIPPPAEVLTGFSTGAGSAGSLTLPAVGDVWTGVSYGPSGGSIGSLTVSASSLVYGVTVHGVTGTAPVPGPFMFSSAPKPKPKLQPIEPDQPALKRRTTTVEDFK